MLGFDITGQLVFDLVFDRRQQLAPCPFRQLDLGQVNALLRKNHDKRVWVLLGNARQFVFSGILPTDIGALLGFVYPGPAKFGELTRSELNQKACHQNCPSVRLTTLVSPFLAR